LGPVVEEGAETKGGKIKTEWWKEKTIGHCWASVSPLPKKKCKN